MEDVNLQLTTAGKVLNAKIQAGKGKIPLEITRVVTAAGYSTEPLELNDLIDPRLEFTITEQTGSGTRAIIATYINNFGNPLTGIMPLMEGYPLTQIGFFAIDPDEGEILYRISQFENPNWVPALRERGWEFKPTFNFTVGNASEVIIQINPTGLAVREDIWNSVEFSDNDKPGFGVRTHHKAVSSATGYKPLGKDLDRFIMAQITETRIEDNPSITNSPYYIALPVTAIQAIFDKNTGASLADFIGLNDSGLSEFNPKEAIPTNGTASTGTLAQLLGRLAYLISQITGKHEWWMPPDVNMHDMLQTIKQISAGANQDPATSGYLGASKFGASFFGANAAETNPDILSCGRLGASFLGASYLGAAAPIS